MTYMRIAKYVMTYARYENTVLKNETAAEKVYHVTEHRVQLYGSRLKFYFHMLRI
jgi:hypothetical protein